MLVSGGSDADSILCKAGDDSPRGFFLLRAIPLLRKVAEILRKNVNVLQLAAAQYPTQKSSAMARTFEHVTAAGRKTFD